MWIKKENMVSEVRSEHQKLTDQQNQETSKKQDHQAMSNPKGSGLKLEGNISENFKNFELRFNDYCIQADSWDLSKQQRTEEHHKKAQYELAALRSALPDETVQVVRYTIKKQITADHKGKPWIWMDRLHAHYTG